MYINRASDLKGHVAAHLLWLGQSSKSHLNGAVWIRSGCFGSTGMRDDAVAESRNCRISLLPDSAEKCASGSKSFVLPQFAFPQWERNGAFVSGRKDSQTRSVLLRTIFFSWAQGRCCRLCLMIFT